MDISVRTIPEDKTLPRRRWGWQCWREGAADQVQEEATGGPQGRGSRQQGESLDVILQVAAHPEPSASPVESSGNAPFRKWKTVCGLLRKMSE